PELHPPLRYSPHLAKGRAVIFGAGAGMPFFSTDPVAIQRALEVKCDEVLVGKNGVDGVYTADPRIDPGARRLDAITFDEAIQRDLRVVDSTAFALCRDNGLPMRVFGMNEAGNVTKALLGEPIGTLVSAS